MQHEMDAPQPLVDRKPSVSLLRWNNNSNNGSGNNTTAHFINNSSSSNIVYSGNQQPQHQQQQQQIYTSHSNRSSFRKQTDTNASKGGSGLPTTSTAARQGLNMCSQPPFFNFLITVFNKVFVN